VAGYKDKFYYPGLELERAVHTAWGECSFLNVRQGKCLWITGIWPVTLGKLLFYISARVIRRQWL
jgi:hypothetical protein